MKEPGVSGPPHGLWARSFHLRAVLALAFLVFYYVAALSIAAALLAIPYLEFHALERVHLNIALPCLLGAGSILWSLVPRREPFVPPGPRVTREEQPRLFEVIDGIARQMGAEVPAEVYLVPEVNAFVTQRGGFLGFGGKRILGLGIPLLAVQNVSQLRSVLAHEFGHFAGGETRLAGVIYATRSAMIRTLENLEKAGRRFLQKPFEWMLKGYLRLTQSISRQQELLADMWSIRIAGKEAHVSALSLAGIHGTGFSLFLNQEVRPLTEYGVAPDNVFEGYRRFLSSSGWERMQPLVKQMLETADVDPFDSHPPLEERLEFAKTVESAESAIDSTPAYSLLTKSKQLEEVFSTSLHPPGVVTVSWDQLGEQWQKMWERMAKRLQARCSGFDVSQLLSLPRDPSRVEELAQAVAPRLLGYRLPDRQEEIDRFARSHAGAWLATILAARGFKFETAPGESVRLACGAEAVDPMALTATAIETHDSVQLSDFLGRHGIELAAKIVLTPDEVTEMTAPAAAVRIEKRKKHLEVTGVLGEMSLPRCCVVCCGPALYRLELELREESFISGQRDGVSLEITTCEEHQKEAIKAFRLVRLNRASGEITLEVKSEEYAGLIVLCNQ